MTKTAEVKQLVHEVLETIPRPYRDDVIARVFEKIEHVPEYRERYETLRSTLGPNVVHQSIGSWTARALGTRGEKQISGENRLLADSYSLLKIHQTPSEASALIESAIDAEELNIARDPTLLHTEKVALITARRGQGEFRKQVLQIERRCRLTGVDDPEHLRASHIQPWEKSDHRQRLDRHNGLMLAPHVDHLFDRGYISFSNDGTLLVASDAIRRLLETWGIDADAPSNAPRPFRPEQCVYLDWHRTNRFELRRTANG